MLSVLFSLKGKITRVPFILIDIPILILGYIAGAIPIIIDDFNIGGIKGDATILEPLFSVVISLLFILTYIHFSLMVKRLHDLGKSSLYAIPVIFGFLYSIYITFALGIGGYYLFDREYSLTFQQVNNSIWEPIFLFTLGPYAAFLQLYLMLGAGVNSGITAKTLIKENIWVPQIIAIGMLLIAFIPSNPYGYYILLRWICFGIFGFLTFRAYIQSKTEWVWLLGVNVVIYNPIFPVHLNRELWSIINAISILILLISIFVIKAKKIDDRNSGPELKELLDNENQQLEIQIDESEDNLGSK